MFGASDTPAAAAELADNGHAAGMNDGVTMQEAGRLPGAAVHTMDNPRKCVTP